MDWERLLHQELKRVIEREDKPVGVLFSGGIDSTAIALILKESKKEFTCYTVGLKGANDILFAKKVADKLNLPIKIKEFNEEEVIKAMKVVKNIIGYDDPIDVPVGTVTYLASKFSNEKIVYSGLGSDEFLGGYHSSKVHGIKKEIEYRRERVRVDIERDKKICNYNDKEVRLPFIEIMDFLISIPEEFKIRNEENKYVLRKMLRDMKVPHEIYSRKKKAAQYGSGFSKIYKSLKRKKEMIFYD